MYEGKFLEAASWLEKALEASRSPDVPAAIRNRLDGRAGDHRPAAGRDRELPRVRRPVELHLPDRPRGRPHAARRARARRSGGSPPTSTNAPGDLRVRWLLNIAYMTLGEYPDKVPPRYLIPVDRFRSKARRGPVRERRDRWSAWARAGPNLAGGSIFDDFTGDGLPDLFTTSLDADLGASLFVNRGDGTFEDRSAAAGLDDQVYALNVTRADFDNDGDLDVLLLRGGWEKPVRLSLLRNKGDGAFEDVTVASGLGEPIATESAAWGDYDNDGLARPVRLRRVPPARRRPVGDARATPATAAGSTTTGATARSWTSPPRPASPTSGAPRGRPGATTTTTAGSTSSSRTWARPCRLYHNEGDGTFRRRRPRARRHRRRRTASPAGSGTTTTTAGSTSTSTTTAASLAEVVADCAGPAGRADEHARGSTATSAPAASATSAARSASTGRCPPMGCNFGDIDNDGYLDIYLGTGGMSYEGLVPNLMFKNVEGRRFEDVTDVAPAPATSRRGTASRSPTGTTTATSTSSSSSAAATPGDRGYNALFQNPGHGRHWLKVKLVGTKTNRAALGARIRVDLKGADGRPRSIYRTIGNNASFGGNSLVESIGLLDATRVDRADRLLADEQDDPDLPRPRRRPGDRDHRGLRRVQGPPHARCDGPAAVSREGPRAASPGLS